MKYAIVKEEFDPEKGERAIVGVLEQGELKEGMSLDADTGAPLYLQVGEVWLCFDSSEWASVSIVDAPMLSKLPKVLSDAEKAEAEITARCGPVTEYGCPKCGRTHRLRPKNAGIIHCYCQKGGTEMVPTEVQECHQ